MTKHETGKWGRTSPLARFGKKRHGASGYDAYQGRTQSWCYRCNTDHAWAKPFPPVIRLSGKERTHD